MNANTTEGPVILAAFANDRVDQTRYLRNLPEEARRIKTALEPAHALCPLVLLPNATLEEILDAFQKYRDRIVAFHYGGHANGFQLLLESAAGGVHRIGAQGLASFLGQQQGLQFVFLNGCSTERQTEDLLDAGIGCVIATTQAIDDRVATDFSARFYRGLVTGAPLQASYAEAVGSAQTASGGSIDRLLVPLEGEADEHVEGRWPWLLKFRPGAERVAQWSLPEAAGDPLFGLPPVPQHDLPESPYRHLYRFEADHAEVFFGRGHEIRELYQRVTAADSPPVVLFYGPSGVGKSSLLDAGLTPRLSSKNEVCYVRRDPAKGLGEGLRTAFSKDTYNLSRRDAWIATEKKHGRPLIIVLDQVEEVYTKPHANLPNELAEFAQLLKRIFFSPNHRPQGKLILGFRKEWFAEIDELLADAQVPRSRIFLERLSRRGAIEAITGPVDNPRLASQYKLKIEAGLPDLIADDLLADPDTPVAPTLQILLTRMWSEARIRDRDKPTFNAELYQSLHRNGILLDDFLRQQTMLIQKQLPRAVDSGFLLDLLEFHTTPIGTSAEHPLRVLEQTYSEQAKSGLLDQTLKLCEEMYLLTFAGAKEHGESRSSRLLHDTLAPLIRARHEDSDLPGQRARRILDNRMVDWVDGAAGLPLDDPDLKAVQAGIEGTRSWSPDEQRLVDASWKLRASQRLWSRIFKGLGVVAVALITISGAVAYFYSDAAQVSEKKRIDAELASQLATTRATAATKAAEIAEAKAQTLEDSAQKLQRIADEAQAKAEAATLTANMQIESARIAEEKAHAATTQIKMQIEIALHEKMKADEAVKTAEAAKALAQTATEEAEAAKAAAILQKQHAEAATQIALAAEKKATKSAIDAEKVAAEAIHRVTELTMNATEQDQLLNIAKANVLLAKQDAEEATQEAAFQMARARSEQTRSERRRAISARDIDQEFIRSAHHFAASAATADHPELNTTMRHAAGYSTAGVRLLDTLEHPDFVHEAWLLKSGFLITWSGSLKSTLLKCWSAEGSVYEIPLNQSCKRVVLSPDETMLFAELAGEGADQIQTFDSQTGEEKPTPADLSLDQLPLPVLYRADVDEQLSSQGLKFLTDVVPHIHGVSFTADQSRVLIWTSKYVAYPNAFVDVVDNSLGIAQVWDTRARVPITPPLKLSLPLRGAKFANLDREILMWGEDGRVLRWELASSSGIKTVTPSAENSNRESWPHEIPFPLPAQSKLARKNGPSALAEASPVIRWDEKGWGATKGDSVMTSYPLPGIYGMQFSAAGQLLAWGGSTGAPGTGSGGFAVQLDPRTGRHLGPLLRHRFAVASASFNQKGSRILTSTWVSEPGNPQPASVHLWDRELGIEVMPAILNFNNMALHAEYGPDDNTLIIHTHTVRQQPEDKIEYLTYTLDITPEVTLHIDDPRIDFVRKTGTFLNRDDELKFLSRGLWKVICLEEPTSEQLHQNNQEKAFEEWLQEFRREE